MTIHRFLIKQEQIDLERGLVTLADLKQVTQIGKVLRLSTGSQIEVLDQSQTVYRIKLTEVGKQSVTGEILSSCKTDKKTAIAITVFLPLLKGGNFESALSKLTEIGVDKIIPIVTERTVVKLAQTTAKADDKMRRWMSIVAEATEQCERVRPPQVVNAQTFSKALNDLRKAGNAGVTFICAERSQAPHLITILYKRLAEPASPVIPPSDISIVIGPEGGFTQQEIEEAISLGCVACRLGDTILKAETAATVAAALVASFGEILWSEARISGR